MHRPLTNRILFSFILICFFIGGIAQDIEKLNLRKPFQLRGTINLQTEFYSASGLENRKKPFSWLISGAPVVTLLGIDMPFSFLFSNFENRYYQPFNQYGISPRYKSLTVHAGYRNISFSPYTLAGYRMLGGGAEITPGKFRLGFMYGRLNRSTAIDSAQLANPLAFRLSPTYTRMAYAARIGIGSDMNYFDISYLKGWDKERSLEQKFRDSLAPAENHVLGLSWKISFLKHFSWQTDLGISHYTNDVHSDKIAPDSTYPKILRQLTKFLGSRISSQLLAAGETKISYTGRWLGLGVMYRRVDPDYKSMGAYFFQSDIQQLTIMPSFRLLKGRLLLNGNLGWQEDNLYRQKLSASRRFVGNANINYNPSQMFGANINFTNFGITRNPLRTSPNDEIFKQVSRSFSIAPYFNFINDNSVKNIQLVSSYQSLNSPVQTINTAPDQHTLFGSVIYSHTWLKQQVSVNASVNYNNTHMTAGDIGSYGGGLGASLPFLKNKLAFSTNATYNSNRFNSVSNGYTLNTDVGVRFRLLKQNSLQLMFNYLKNESKDQTVIQTFDEKTFRIGYGISF